jgi:hypothetical protein
VLVDPPRLVFGEQFRSHLPLRFFLIIDIRKPLPVLIADNKRRANVSDGPRGRKATFCHNLFVCLMRNITVGMQLINQRDYHGHCGPS